MDKIIAFCGLICSECPVYIATEAGDEELKEKLAKEYSTESFKFEKDDMNCTGCHSIEGVNKKMCVECPVRQCGMEKKLTHCAECNEYPCQHIEGYVPAGSDNRRTLDGLANKDYGRSQDDQRRRERTKYEESKNYRYQENVQ